MPLVPVLLLALPWPALAAPSADWLSAEEAMLFKDRDPAAASALIDDPRFAALDQTDPMRHARWLAQATELAGLAHLLRSQTDPVGLVQGFENWFVDDAAGFGLRPDTFEAWARQRVPEADPDVTAQALYDWKTLGPSARDSLVKRGRGSGGWATTGWSARRDDLKEWADKALPMIESGPAPKTSSQRALLEAQLDQIQLVEPERGKELDAVRGIADRSVDAAQRSTEGSVAAGQAAGKSAIDDPGQAFDNSLTLKPPPGFDAAPAPAGGRALDAQQQSLLTSMLRSRLLSDIGDVPLGKRVQDFYRAHALHLAIGSVDANAVAQYDPDADQMTIGAASMDDWLSSQGRTRADLLTDGKLLDQFVMATEPTFVHEAEHQRQKVWRDESSAEQDLSGQNDEVEAMMAEAAFVLQKSAASPRYAAFIQRSGPLESEDRELSEQLRSDPQHFGGYIESQYYPEVASSEELASFELSHRQVILNMISAELRARASRPKASQADLPVPQDLLASDWRPFIRKAPTSQLNRLFSKMRQETLGIDGSYLRERQRTRQIVDQMNAAANWAPPDAVPSPGGQR